MALPSLRELVFVSCAAAARLITAGIIAMPIEPSRLHSRKPIVRKQGSHRPAHRRIRSVRLNSQEPIAAEEVKPAGLRRSPTTLRVLRASGTQPLASLKRSLRA